MKISKNYVKENQQNLLLRTIKPWRSLSMALSESIGSPRLSYKNVIIFLVQKPKNQKKKIFMKELFLSKKLRF